MGGSRLSSQPLKDGLGPPLPLVGQVSPLPPPLQPGSVHSLGNLAPLDLRAQVVVGDGCTGASPEGK